MATYYFAPASEGGSVVNSGTSAASPWIWPTSFYAKAQSSKFTAGDSVLFKSGAVFAGNDSGMYLEPSYFATQPTTASPFTIGVYGGTRRATFTSTVNSAWYMYNMGGITISDIDIVGTNYSAVGLNFYNEGAGPYGSLIIDRVSVRGFNYGCYMGGNGAAKWTGNRVRDCEFSYNKGGGMTTYGTGAYNAYVLDDLQVLRCQANYNYGDPQFTTGHSGSGIILGNCTNSLMEQCTAHHNGGNDASAPNSGPGGLWMYNCSNTTIRRSLSYSNRRGAVVGNDGLGFDIDVNCFNCVLEYNTSYNNEGEGLLAYNGNGSTGSGSIIRFNTSINDATKYQANGNQGGLIVGGNYNGLLIHNNTVVTSNPAPTVAPVVFLTTSLGTYTNVRVLNNIFVNLSGGPSTIAQSPTPSTNVLMQGNLYWNGTDAGIAWNGTTYPSLAAFRATVANQELNGGTAVGVVGDPLFAPFGFTDNVTQVETAFPAALRSNSPAAVAAVNMTALGISPGTRDLANRTLRATNGSIGAQQSPLLALNTAQNPNLVQLLVATEEGLYDYAAEKGAGTSTATSGRKKDAVQSVKNGTGNSYVTES